MVTQLPAVGTIDSAVVVVVAVVDLIGVEVVVEHNCSVDGADWDSLWALPVELDWIASAATTLQCCAVCMATNQCTCPARSMYTDGNAEGEMS